MVELVVVLLVVDGGVKSCANILFMLGAFAVDDGAVVDDVVVVEAVFEDGAGLEPHGLGNGSVFSVPA